MPSAGPGIHGGQGGVYARVTPVLCWNAAFRHRCPCCARVAIDMGRASSWLVYDCWNCCARFTRWPHLAWALPDAGSRSYRLAVIGTYDSAAGRHLARAVRQHAQAASWHAGQGNLHTVREHLELALRDVDFMIRNVPDERLPHAAF